MRTAVTRLVWYSSFLLVIGALAADYPCYEEDFENILNADAELSQWSLRRTETAPNGRTYLGMFGCNPGCHDNCEPQPCTCDSPALTLAELPAHSYVSVSFSLYIIRSWDGNGVYDPMPYPECTTAFPDRWWLRVQGGGVVLGTTFSNITTIVYKPECDRPVTETSENQAYPDIYPGGDHPAQYGADEVNTLGYEYGNVCVISQPMDSVYHIKRAFPHKETSLTLEFVAEGLSTIDDESWGLDNVEVWATTWFKRGDTNADGERNIADAICLLGYLFGPQTDPCEQKVKSCFDAGDANDDGKLDIADAVKILAYLFATEGPLPAPFPDCGSDGVADALGCDLYEKC